MASSSTPRVLAFKAGGAINPNSFVKFGSDDETVVAAAAGNASIGVAQVAEGGAALASGDRAEVALPGGGAKLKLGGTVTRGDLLKSDASGYGVVASTNLDVYGAKAMASGVSGDVIPVEVMQGHVSNL